MYKYYNNEACFSRTVVCKRRIFCRGQSYLRVQDFVSRSYSLLIVISVQPACTCSIGTLCLRSSVARSTMQNTPARVTVVGQVGRRRGVKTRGKKGSLFHWETTNTRKTDGERERERGMFSSGSHSNRARCITSSRDSCNNAVNAGACVRPTSTTRSYYNTYMISWVHCVRASVA